MVKTIDDFQFFGKAAKRLKRLKLWALEGEKIVSLRCDRSVEASKKTKKGGIMLLGAQRYDPKIRQDLNVLQQNFLTHGKNLKLHPIKMKEPFFQI